VPRVRLAVAALAILVAALACSRGSKDVAPGTQLDGLSEDGASIHLRIDWVSPDPKGPDPTTPLYGVSVKAGDAWVPYCAPDRTGVRAAYALSGSYSTSRPWQDSGAVTFACTSGALGKCVRLGYAPWRSTRDGRSLRPFHEACVRMIRADYCGDGRTHTVDGTPIDVHDAIGVQSREPPDPAHPRVLEAGWSPSGATFLHRARLADDVAAIVAECPDKLAGRTSAAGAAAPTDAEIVARYPETLIVDDRDERRR
jgi:hypothetical protein